MSKIYFRFTPLDAAGPMFDLCPPEARVSKTDAAFVDFIKSFKTITDRESFLSRQTLPVESGSGTMG